MENGAPTGTRNARIQFEPNAYGGRLTYFDRPSAPELWDEQWVEKERDVNYARVEAGYLPRYMRRILNRWVPQGAKVLEAGCGLGRFTIAANALGYTAEGVDFAPHVIARLQSRYAQIRFFVGDVTDLKEVPSGHYQAVYSPGVCEHFEDGPEAVLRETFRILAPGGTALVQCPYFNALRRTLVTFGMFRAKPSGLFYQYAFNRMELARRLEQVGFDVVAVEPFEVSATLDDHLPGFAEWRRQSIGQKAVAVLERTPMVRLLGHCAMWVARKRGAGRA